MDPIDKTQESEITKYLLDEIDKIHRELEALKSTRLHQSDIPNNTIKQRHLEALVIFTGTAANRPSTGTKGIQAYFATDTLVLSIWTGSAWKSSAAFT